MEDGREFKITLPNDLADAVERRVASGEYDSVEAVLREGLEAVFDRDLDDVLPQLSEAAIDQWLREDVVKTLADYDADPSAAVPIEEVMTRFQARRAARKGKSDCA
jgi:Arc/MetJ-type ribon-helix-helix transcriptional regulator